MADWASTVPLVSAFAAVFSAGVAWSTLRHQAKDIERLEKRCKDDLRTAVADVRDEHQRSAKEQGTRIGDLRSDCNSLLEWRAEVRGAERERRRTAAHGIPVQDE